MVKKYDNDTFFCFSPPVMLATFAVEIVLLIYVLWRYKLTRVTQLSTLLLFFLATFQLAEYMVCGGWGISGLDWSRVGFVAITLLPPLGLHLVYELASKRNKPLLIAAYTTAIVFVGYFFFATTAFVGNQCQGNYAIFELTQPISKLYGIFYYGWVLTGLWLAWRFARQARQQNQRLALRIFALGYAAFLVPTAIVNLLDPKTLAGIPSIMCGFAIIFALLLSLGVLPRTAKRK